MKKPGVWLRSRRGVSLAESILLIIVILIAFSSVFSTLSAASRSYVNVTLNAGSRVTLFNWVQAFESLWPDIYPNPIDAFENAALALNGTWNSVGRYAFIGGYRVETTAREYRDGSLVVGFLIPNPSGEAPFASMDRRYNMFSSETVSDDSL